MNEFLTLQLVARSCLETVPVHHAGAHLRAVDARPTLDQVKRELLRKALATTSEARVCKRICGAANWAAELAWASPQPAVVFPTVFQELVRRACAEMRAA